MAICAIQGCENEATTTMRLPNGKSIEVCDSCADNDMAPDYFQDQLEDILEKIEQLSEKIECNTTEKQGEKSEGFYKTG